MEKLSHIACLCHDNGSDGDCPHKPAGGYDPTPFPMMLPGYTVEITFHRANNLARADLRTLQSDPFILAHLKTPKSALRHPEIDPKLRVRTRTIHRELNPEWNHRWIVGDVPASGFKLKIRIYDEDAMPDRDDRLGDARLKVDEITPDWPGIKEQSLPLRIHKMDRFALVCHTALSLAHAKNPRTSAGDVVVSVRLIGPTRPAWGSQRLKEGSVEDCGKEGGGRPPFTIGPCHWSIHYATFVGRITDTKMHDVKRHRTQYAFQANQMQLRGPVPSALYHRYVEFKGFVKPLFTNTGLEGRLLHHGVSDQHRSVYQYNSQTTYGTIYALPRDPTDIVYGRDHSYASTNRHTVDFDKHAHSSGDEISVAIGEHKDVCLYNKEGSDAVSRRFLRMAHYGEGKRLFTYVITLDGMLRFTETGKEFNIDQLSKHTMHSNASIYIAWSGEFFLRRKHPFRRNHTTKEKRAQTCSKHTDRHHLRNLPQALHILPQPLPEKNSEEPFADPYAGYDTCSECEDSDTETEVEEDPDDTSDGEEEDEKESEGDTKEQRHEKEAKDVSHSRRVDKSEEVKPPDENDNFHKDEQYIAAKGNREEEKEEDQDDSIPKDPEAYILIIDNDSGTYRPEKKLIPLFKAYLASQLVDLEVRVYDCGSRRLQRWKKQRRAAKKRLAKEEKLKWTKQVHTSFAARLLDEEWSDSSEHADAELSEPEQEGSSSSGSDNDDDKAKDKKKKAKHLHVKHPHKQEEEDKKEEKKEEEKENREEEKEDEKEDDDVISNNAHMDHVHIHTAECALHYNETATFTTLSPETTN